MPLMSTKCSLMKSAVSDECRWVGFAVSDEWMLFAAESTFHIKTVTCERRNSQSQTEMSRAVCLHFKTPLPSLISNLLRFKWKRQTQPRAAVDSTLSGGSNAFCKLLSIRLSPYISDDKKWTSPPSTHSFCELWTREWYGRNHIK